MKKYPKRAAAVMLVTLLCLLFTSLPASAADSPTLMRVTDKQVSSYPAVSVVTDAGTVVRARLIHDATYIAVRDFVEALSAGNVSYAAATRCATVTDKNFTMEVTDGAYLLWANGRALFSLTPAVILSDGKLYAPVRPLAKAFGVDVIWQGSLRRVLLHGSVSYLENASSYYDADTVFWLGRIIHAESAGEPLLGKIAVGNVILNRVRSRDYPNTVWGVIFDRKYGTQFSPVDNGSIYNVPSADSLLAAKICLDGFSLSESALFFLEPTKSTSFWIPHNRPYLFTIGHHAFYT